MLLRVLYPYKNINIYIIIDAKQIQELLSPWRKETQQSLRVFVASFPIRFFFLLLSLFIYIFQSSLAEECWKSARAAYAKRFAARSIQNFVSFNDEEKAFRCYRQTSSNLNANEAPLNSPRFNGSFAETPPARPLLALRRSCCGDERRRFSQRV